MQYHELKAWLDKELASVCESSQQCHTERDWFLKDILALSSEMIYREPETVFTNNDKLSQLKNCLKKRIEERQPIQYLLGYAMFYGHRFKVTPDVLIPRPETESLIELAMQVIQAKNASRVLDLGTGSGCIAITLKKLHPHLQVTAIDSSEKALAIASHNARQHATEIQFLQSDWYAELKFQKQFDIIISNPPYIDQQQEYHALTQEVLQEPHQALFSPNAPEDLYSELIQTGWNYLAQKGTMLFELGDGLREKLDETLIDFKTKTSKQSTWTFEKDYANKDRFLVLNS